MRSEAELEQGSDAFRLGKEVLEGCISGAPGARDRFVTQYERLVRFAVVSVLRQRHLSLQAEEIQDLCQGVFLSLFDRDCRKLRMYDGRHQASLATFLRVCAIRFTLDHLRRERRRPVLLDDLPEAEGRARLDEAADPAAGPEAAAVSTQRIAKLRAAMEELGPRDRLFVRLHFLEQIDIGQVARVLGIQENAAYVVKSRVRKRLRDLMGEVLLGDD